MDGRAGLSDSGEFSPGMAGNAGRQDQNSRAACGRHTSQMRHAIPQSPLPLAGEGGPQGQERAVVRMSRQLVQILLQIRREEPARRLQNLKPPSENPAAYR